MSSYRAIALAGVVVVMAATPPRLAAAESVSGRVIDLACYMMNKANTEQTHVGRGYACAQACAKEGFQVGLLTEAGRVFEVTGGLAANKNAKLVPHMGHTVTIVGDIGQRDGFATISANDLTVMPVAPKR